MQSRGLDLMKVENQVYSREGQYPAALSRCKFDAPLIAAGVLTSLRV